MNTNECCGCEAEKAKPEYAERSQACKDLSELSTIEGCEAWIKRECPNCRIHPPVTLTSQHGKQLAMVYETDGYHLWSALEASPLLALQSVIGQIIKWRER